MYLEAVGPTPAGGARTMLCCNRDRNHHLKNEQEGKIVERIVRFLTISLIAGALIMAFAASPSPALAQDAVTAATHIVNLEAKPKVFRPEQPIDFVVNIRYDGAPHGGFDVGVFHEGRLVGWEMNKTLRPGVNVFKLHDKFFRGDPGDYVVKVRLNGVVFKEKRFKTRAFRAFTLDPKYQPPGW
jgi:hypothetical protein